MTKNLVNSFLSHARSHPEKVALFHLEKGKILSTTYSELAKQVLQAAQYFSTQDIGFQDRVLIYARPGLDLYLFTLALFYLGAVAVFVDPWAAEDRLLQASELTGSRVLFTNIPLEPHKIPGLRQFFLPEILPELIPLPPAAFPPASLTAQNEVIIGLTSGTTGNPKAGDRNLAFSLAQQNILSKYFPVSPDDIDLPLIPNMVFKNLLDGASTLLLPFALLYPAPDLPQIHSLMEQIPLSTTTGPPAFYLALAEYVSTHKLTVPFKRLIIGGAPLSPTQASLLKAAFPETEIQMLYGSTEVAPMTLLSLENLLRHDILSGLLLGKPIPELEIKILRPQAGPLTLNKNEKITDYTLPAVEIGELIVSGPNVLGGYLNSPEAQALNKIVEHGKIWHRTGDAASFDAHGNLLFFGRMGQGIGLGQKPFYPLPLELKLQEIGPIRYSALLIKDDLLHIFLETEQNTDKGKLEGKLRQILASHPLPPHKIYYLAEIPKDPRHRSRIDYHKLHEIIESR